MPLSDAFLQKTLRIFSGIRPVTSRKMFGGAGIYFDDLMFCVLDDDKIFFKVDTSNEAAYLKHKAAAWSPGGTNMGYRELPKSILKNEAELGNWIDAAVKVATNKKKNKKPKP